MLNFFQNFEIGCYEAIFLTCSFQHPRRKKMSIQSLQSWTTVISGFLTGYQLTFLDLQLYGLVSPAIQQAAVASLPMQSSAQNPELWLGVPLFHVTIYESLFLSAWTYFKNLAVLITLYTMRNDLFGLQVSKDLVHHGREEITEQMTIWARHRKKDDGTGLGITFIDTLPHLSSTTEIFYSFSKQHKFLTHEPVGDISKSQET